AGTGDGGRWRWHAWLLCGEVSRDAGETLKGATAFSRQRRQNSLSYDAPLNRSSSTAETGNEIPGRAGRVTGEPRQPHGPERAGCRGIGTSCIPALCLALTGNPVPGTLIAGTGRWGWEMSVQWRTRPILGVLAASLVTAALVIAPGAVTASAASCEVWTGVPPPSPGAAENGLGAVTAPGP